MSDTPDTVMSHTILNNMRENFALVCGDQSFLSALDADDSICEGWGWNYADQAIERPTLRIGSVAIRMSGRFDLPCS